MFKKLAPFVVVVFIIYACSNSSENSMGNSDNFDRAAMLKNYADNNIVPAFVDLNDRLTDLKSKIETFNETPSEVTLNEVRTSWFQAYKLWQHVAKFNIGKAEELQFLNHFNIYPLNSADVENNITNGDYDLNHPNNHDAQGFPAIDYLIYGLGTNEEIIAKFSTDKNASNYKKYLLDVATKMLNVNKAITDDWNNGYVVTFFSNSGNTATSSLNMLVNDFVYYYEKRLRSVKIAYACGSIGGKLRPELVEAFYRKDVSKQLALEALNSFQDFFEGKSFNGDIKGESFKTYLEYLNREDLVLSITNRLDSARIAINKLDNNFVQQIATDNTKMTMAFDRLDGAVKFLKSDMLQAFNVSVDYIDSDGD